MNEIDDESEFVTKGIVHYGFAMRACDDFRELLPERLTNVVANYQWLHWKPASGWRDERTEHKSNVRHVWLSIGVPGSFKGESARLELGLWWFAPSGDECAVYAGFHEAPWRKKLAPPADGGAKRTMSSTAYLLVGLDKGMPLDEGAHKALGYLEAAAEIARST